MKEQSVLSVNKTRYDLHDKNSVYSYFIFFKVPVSLKGNLNKHDIPKMTLPKFFV